MIAFAALQTRTLLACPDHGAGQNGTGAVATSLGQALIESFDRLEHGLLLLDANLHVHFASAKARQQLTSRELFIEGDRLCAEAGDEIVTLRRLVARCARAIPLPAGPVLFCRAGEVLLQVAPLATPAPVGRDGNGRLIAVFVIDHERPAIPTAEQLRIQFGLTAAEAAVACEIVNGAGLKECADRFGVAESTARTHLQSVFAKTGTKRQAQLVRVVLASRPVIREG